MVLAKLTASHLDKSRQKEILGAAASFIKNTGISYEEVLVFGSAARKEMTAYSDLDLLVIVSESSKCPEVYRALVGLSTAIQWPVDLVVSDRKSYKERSNLGGLFAIVKIEGRPLVEIVDDIESQP